MLKIYVLLQFFNSTEIGMKIYFGICEKNAIEWNVQIIELPTSYNVSLSYDI